ncbi:nucleotide disphospho-sugar-binding domain-containing protein [Pseudarthrobacter sp. H2]|uniref:nucleotide disphospho-sugar-binding domain-containing protein n=1 Tax=Pseudarthrobacter sp. H2 TaxID=3418415 RepID=UPI003CF5F39D
MNRRPDFFRLCLEAFGHSQWDVAMAIGEQTDRGLLGPIPAKVRIEPFFPQLQVLRQADVFLTHAGMNSTMEALYFGVPLVAVPQQPEQEATARRLEELGLGRRLAAGDVTAPDLLRAVSEVSANRGIREKVAAMRGTIRGAGGATAAATAIEAHAHDPSVY